MNATNVTEEVNRIKNRPNLLLWYVSSLLILSWRTVTYKQ